MRLHQRTSAAQLKILPTLPSAGLCDHVSRTQRFGCGSERRRIWKSDINSVHLSNPLNHSRVPRACSFYCLVAGSVPLLLGRGELLLKARSGNPLFWDCFGKLTLIRNRPPSGYNVGLSNSLDPFPYQLLASSELRSPSWRFRADANWHFYFLLIVPDHSNQKMDEGSRSVCVFSI